MSRFTQSRPVHRARPGGGHPGGVTTGGGRGVPDVPSGYKVDPAVSPTEGHLDGGLQQLGVHDDSQLGGVVHWDVATGGPQWG